MYVSKTVGCAAGSDNCCRVCQLGMWESVCDWRGQKVRERTNDDDSYGEYSYEDMVVCEK